MKETTGKEKAIGCIGFLVLVLILTFLLKECHPHFYHEMQNLDRSDIVNNPRVDQKDSIRMAASNDSATRKFKADSAKLGKKFWDKARK